MNDTSDTIEARASTRTAASRTARKPIKYPLFYEIVPSPIGELLLAGHSRGLVLLELPGPGGGHMDVPSGWQRLATPLTTAIQQLDEYFSGIRQVFDLPLWLEISEFQHRVLDALQAIPYGETRSYKQIAARIGRPSASRAVGRANAENPLPVIIPCHRVTGSDGSLTGYRGGLAIKRKLLEHERENRPPSSRT